MRNYSLSDQFCLRADRLLRLITGHNAATEQTRANPAQHIPESGLSAVEKKQVAGMMRVNYAGEVCAQALYQGQALTAKNRDTRRKLTQAGLEEYDHLFWCQTRLQELNSHVSYLNPVWYGGAFALGVLAGFCGDRWNLGFLAETEKQVTEHLETHLQQLPAHDRKTAVVLQQMRDEEAEHAQTALTIGAAELPFPLKIAMRFTAKIMTMTAYWV